MGHKAMILIICDGCKKRMTNRHWVGSETGNYNYDACSMECAAKVAAEREVA